MPTLPTTYYYIYYSLTIRITTRPTLQVATLTEEISLVNAQLLDARGQREEANQVMQHRVSVLVLVLYSASTSTI